MANKRRYHARYEGSGAGAPCPECGRVLGKVENYGKRAVKFHTRCRFCKKMVTLVFGPRKKKKPEDRAAALGERFRQL